MLILIHVNDVCPGRSDQNIEFGCDNKILKNNITFKCLNFHVSFNLSNNAHGK